MRIVVLGAKGGVGKSIVTLLLIRTFLERGKKILLVDRDMTGYISWLAGIRGKGLVASIVDNETGNYFTTLNIGKGILRVVKFYGDGPRLISDSQLFSREDIGSQIREKYDEIISLPHDHVIYDNRGMVEPGELEYSLEIGIYLRKFPHTKSYWVFVSDSLKMNIEMTLDYDQYIWNRWAKNMNVVGRSLVINMVPPNYAIPYEEIGGLSRYDSVTTVPFMDELFEFTGKIESMPSLSSLEPLAKAIESKI
ncbi:P-loop NTPase [Metallosphaera hakonensis]|uniref:CobQ/CobB/MinD/ParA nucleotide binding domain-containing protein n=1 Tax=Metallosphaera hakonensis JCM 8857 = DSM 7519 TaxID=1293036 RepID=A0A2U9ISL5_9CREN|nr:P-loop NTPase [Metallosphaera hakonensis]AWR99016.1 P-loop NTPase [Metallosphaera hakonensis JCM 8857 = DSM 7519]